MNHKPDKATLIAYLYHELDEEKTQRVEAYLQDHPEEKAELESLWQVHHLMEKSMDEAPPLVLPDLPKEKSATIASNRIWPIIGSMAACLALLIIFISSVGLQIQYSDQTLTIQMGREKKAPTAQQDQELSQDYIQAMHQTVRQELGYLQDSLSSTLYQLQQLQISLQQQMDQAHQQGSIIRKELAQMIQANEKENNHLISEIIFQVTQQRAQDLKIIEETLLDIQLNTEEKQYQTELVLSQLFTQLNQVNHEKK